MPRLSAALLIAWLAILGGAAPAIACAAAPAGDCCPDGGSAPCMDADPAAADGARACCAAIPNPTPMAVAAPNRVEQAKPTDGGSPDLASVPVSTSAPAPAVSPQGEVSALASLATRDASRTYLRTLRLRL